MERLQLTVDGTMYLLVPELVVLLYKFAPSSALPPCAEVKILMLSLFDQVDHLFTFTFTFTFQTLHFSLFLFSELVVLLYKFAPSSALPPCAEVKILLLSLFDHFLLSLFEYFSLSLFLFPKLVVLL